MSDESARQALQRELDGLGSKLRVQRDVLTKMERRQAALTDALEHWDESGELLSELWETGELDGRFGARVRGWCVICGKECALTSKYRPRTHKVLGGFTRCEGSGQRASDEPLEGEE